MNEEEKQGYFPGNVGYQVDKEYPPLNHLNSYLIKVYIEIVGIHYGLMVNRVENIKEVTDAEAWLFNYEKNKKEELISRVEFESKLPFKKYDYTAFSWYPDFPPKYLWTRGVSFLARKILDYDKRKDSDIYVFTPSKEGGEIFEHKCWWAVFSDIRNKYNENPQLYYEEKIPGNPREQYVFFPHDKAYSFVHKGYDSLRYYLYLTTWKSSKIKNLLLDNKNITEIIKPSNLQQFPLFRKGNS